MKLPRRQFLHLAPRAPPHCPAVSHVARAQTYCVEGVIATIEIPCKDAASF
jgi:hypothetical protein